MLPVEPAVFLLGDEQRDDVSLGEAEQGLVAARGVWEDGFHLLLFHHVQTGGNRNRSL